MSDVLQVIVPIFGIVLLGYVLVRIRVFSDATSEGLSRFVFYVAVPAMLFRTLATATLPSEVPWAYIACYYVPTFLVFCGGLAIAGRRFGWSRKEQGIAAITASYSNMVMLGMPLVLAAFGEDAALPLFILLALQSTLIFPATTWVIEVYGRDADGGGATVARTTARLFVNPVILSLGLGIVANVSGFELRDPVARALDIIGAAAPACALVALGVGLAQHEFRGGLDEALTFVALKSVAHPVLVWFACLAAGVPDGWAHVAILLAAMPSGINAFIFARNYHLRVSFVSRTIVVTTLVSTITITLLLRAFL